MGIGTCPKCEKHSYLMRLHGDKGGPLMCPICCGAWNAKSTRARRFGRTARKALELHLENVPSLDWKDRSELIKASVVLGLLDDGKVSLGFNSDTEPGELTSELLTDVLKLTHPDRHPPERQELAKRVAQELLALQPFVFAAPKPKPPPVYKPTTGETDETDEIIRRHREKRQAEAQKSRYPCELCAQTVSYFYCDPCKAEWRKRQEAEQERRRAKQREQYAQRQRRKAWRRPSRLCAADCGALIEALRKDAKFCSPACRQRDHRQRAKTQ
jgi:hypothetical protein